MHSWWQEQGNEVGRWGWGCSGGAHLLKRKKINQMEKVVSVGYELELVKQDCIEEAR